jgi:hypothetical protein
MAQQFILRLSYPKIRIYHFNSNSVAIIQCRHIPLISKMAGSNCKHKCYHENSQEYRRQDPEPWCLLPHLASHSSSSI